MATLVSQIGRQFEVFAVLRYRDLRLFWLALLAQVASQQMTMVTIGWLTFHLTGSPLTLGIINLLQALPRILLTMVGGAMADRLDQRLVITMSQITGASILGGLAALTLAGMVQVWHLGLAAVLIGFVHAIDQPSRQSLFPHLLPSRDVLPAAVPVISMAWQVSRVTAPAIAGFVIGMAGAGHAFLLAAVGAGTMAMVVRLLRVGHIERERKGSMASNIVEGAKYVWGHGVFRMVMGMAFFNSIFCLGYTLMLPIFAEEIHGVGPEGLGLMYSSIGVGGVTALLFVSRIVKAYQPGPVILASLAAFALSGIAFAMSPSFILAVVLLALMGGISHIYLSAGEILLQSWVPDQLRGRVMGLNGMLWSLMPLGGALLNATANFIGARYALAGGATFVLLFVLLVGIRHAGLRNARLQHSTETPGERSPA